MQNNAKNRIIFTGGGSAGHVTPNLAIIAALDALGWKMAYIGSYQGLEKDIIANTKCAYFPISVGKLRRYFSWQNFVDPFKMLWGIVQASYFCARFKPDVVFSKGGFVAFPVVVAAWMQRIPVIAHESDLTPGLANRLSYYFADKVCITFPEGKKYFKHTGRVTLTGTPIRKELLQGSAQRGRSMCQFNADKPILLVMGGGLGAVAINHVIENSLDELLQRYQIIHICGQQQSQVIDSQPGYQRFTYVHEPLADLLACADVVVSRAGSNSLWELKALAKPNLLIPLSNKASRGDQIINANYFAQKGYSQVLLEEDLSSENLLQQLDLIQANYANLKAKLTSTETSDACESIVTEILRSAKKNSVSLAQSDQ